MAHDKDLKRRQTLTPALESISRNGYEGTREQLLGEALADANGQLIEHFEQLHPEKLSPRKRSAA